MTHICVGKLTIIGSGNGLLPGQRQAIIWTNAGIMLIGPLGTNISEILIAIHTFSLKKMHLKMSSGKWRPFCLSFNVISCCMLFQKGEALKWKLHCNWLKCLQNLWHFSGQTPWCGLSHLRLWRTATACSLVRLYHPAPMLAWCGEGSYPHSGGLALTVWLFQFSLARCLFPTAPCHQTSSARKTWSLGRRGAARWVGHLGK